MCGDEFSICHELGYAMTSEPGGTYSEYTAYCLDGADVVGSVLELADLTELYTEALSEELANAATGPSVTLSPSSTVDILSLAEGSFAKGGGITIPPGDGDIDFSWYSEIDPRKNYMTGIRNQGQCGSCWGFSAVGVVEASYSILHDEPSMKMDLSEEYLNSDCSAAGSCCGGNAPAALDTFRDDGVPDEACMPYVEEYLTDVSCSCYGATKEDGTPAGCPDTCPNSSGSEVCSFTACAGNDNGLPSALCSDADNRRVFIDDYVHINSGGGTQSIDVEMIQDLLINVGPLSFELLVQP